MKRRYPATRLLALALSIGALQLFEGERESSVNPAATSSTGTMSEAEILANLENHNRERDSHLHQYTVTRDYTVLGSDGTVRARTVVQMEYQSPGTKRFVTLCQQGSHLIGSLVFKRLMESEIEAASGKSRHDSSITPANYDFRLLGEYEEGGRQNFVLQAIPKRNDKYLFEGEIWIDKHDFAITRVAGHPARNPSFWLKRVDFVRQYRTFDEFWLPYKDESVNHLKLLGKRTLVIEYSDYILNSPRSTLPAGDQSSRAGCRLPNVSN